MLLYNDITKEEKEIANKVFSETFKPFLNEFSAWISDGCKENDIFVTCCGICYNYHKWLRYSHSMNYHMAKIVAYKHSLPNLFKSEGLKGAYPFVGDKNVDDTYKNPERLAWIESHK